MSIYGKQPAEQVHYYGTPRGGRGIVSQFTDHREKVETT